MICVTCSDASLIASKSDISTVPSCALGALRSGSSWSCNCTQTQDYHAQFQASAGKMHCLKHDCWSDETHFPIWKSIWVLLMPGKRYLPEVPTVTFNLVWVMVFVCFPGFGLGPLFPVRDYVNVTAYIFIKL